MIFDAIEMYLRGDVRPTPERIAWAEAVVGGSGLHSFRRNFVKREARETGRAPVSGSSRWFCTRHLYYDLSGLAKEGTSPRSHLAFFIGDGVEDMVVGLAILAGVPVIWPDKAGRQREVVRVMEGDEIPGHIDMTVLYEGRECPVEIKSMAEYGWEKAKKSGVDDTFGYVGQLQFYMDALGTDRGFFVGVNKSTGHTFEQEIRRDQIAIEAIDGAYWGAKHANGVAPERPAWATTKRIAGCEQIESVRCGYCGHRATCWPGFEMTVVGGKPVYRRPVEESAPVENQT